LPGFSAPRDDTARAACGNGAKSEFLSFSVFEGRFAAKEEGNLFALALSSAALVNIPLPENRNDRAWYSRAGFVPGKGIPVQVEICFEVSKKDGRQ
jgi:hypothetical protein